MTDLSPTDPGLVFVGGAPRSGTTLLRRVLSAHPAVYAGPEFDLLPRLVKLRDMAQGKVLDALQAHLAEGSLPIAEQLAGEVLSLPMGPHLFEEVMDRVVEAVRLAV